MLQPGLGTETQPAMPWGELVTPAPCSVLGLAEQVGFSSANRGDNIALAHLSHKQSLSMCRLNPRDPPLTHSFQGTSQDLRTTRECSFASPFLTAAFRLPAQSHTRALKARLGVCLHKAYAHLPANRVAPKQAKPPALPRTTSLELAPETLLNNVLWEAAAIRLHQEDPLRRPRRRSLLSRDRCEAFGHKKIQD